MKSLIFFFALLAFLIPGAMAQERPARLTGIFAFTRIAIVDVENGRLARDQTVIVNNGRIVAVGPSKTVAVPPKAKMIDGRGKFLAPGFADMHVHLYTEGDAFTYLANGITTVRNMAGDASHLAFKRRTASGDMIGPRIITAGPVIETKLSHPDNVLVKTVAEARSEVERQHAAGYDFIKVYNDITPETYQAVVETARRLNMTVAGHVPDAIGLFGALNARQVSIEHLRGYLNQLVPPSELPSITTSFRDRTILWNSIDTRKIKKLARRTVESGVWNCPTFAFTVHEISPASVHQQLVSRPETRWLSLSGLPTDRTTGYLSGFTESDFAAAQSGLENQFRLVKALDKAGAGLLVGTDSWLSGYAFADELELLVKSGLLPSRVLKMATLDAARFLGEENERGSIKTGKIADLVVLDADPLALVGNARKVRGVMTDGRYHDREMIDRTLEALRPRLKKVD